MKNKKRALAIWLAGSMLVLSGCQDKSGAPAQEAPEEPVQEQKTEESFTEAEAEGEPGVLQITFSTETADDYDPESGQWLLHTEYQKIQAEGGLEEAARAIEQWSEERAQEIEEERERQKGYAALEEGMEPTDYNRYSIYESLQAVRIDRQIVSLIEGYSEYTGGAHGSYGSRGISFDAESGKLLELSDILTDTEGFQQMAEEALIQELSDTYGEGLFPDYEDTVHKIWESGANWYLDGAGITFIFQPYEVGPYAMGEAAVTLPYGEIEAYLESSFLPEYLRGPFGAGIVKIPKGEEISLFFADTDSQSQKLFLDIAEEIEGNGYGPVRLRLGDSSVETEIFERIGNAYLISRTDGRVFLLFDADYASDDFVTFVYELTNGVLKECERQDGLSLQSGTINTESLRLRMHLDVIGTYYSFMDYTINADGNLEAMETWFEIPVINESWQQMLTIKELPVWIDEEETTLPAGSHIRITATDNQGIARFLETDTGVTGEIHYVKGDGAEDTWTVFIDGIQDQEYFEMVPYAG